MKKKETENERKAKELVQRAAEILDSLAIVKPLYRELDDITLALIGMDIFSIVYGDIQLTVVDNFSEKNTCFRVGRFKRFDVEIERKKDIFRISEPKEEKPREKPKAKPKRSETAKRPEIFTVRK